jgi:hypothetical protein
VVIDNISFPPFVLKQKVEKESLTYLIDHEDLLHGINFECLGNKSDFSVRIFRHHETRCKSHHLQIEQKEMSQLVQKFSNATEATHQALK